MATIYEKAAPGWRAGRYLNWAVQLNVMLFSIATVCPAMGQTLSPRNSQETVGILRLSDMGANEVLDLLENYTGKSILRQQNLPAVKINFSSRGPMSKEEAILAVESLLSMNGIAITELGEKFLKAVPSASVGTQVPPMLETTTLASEASQKIYAKFFRLNYLTPAEAIPLIQPMLTQGAPIAFEKSNSLLLTDALINLQRIENVLDKIDQPEDVDIEILFVQLKHVVASEIVQRLESMQAGSLKRYLENNTTFDADDRSNQLIIFTHPSNLKIIGDLIDKLDIDVAPLTQTEVFQLKHADATEVVSLIEQVITGQQRTRDESRGSAPQTRQQANRQQGAAPQVAAQAATSARVAAISDSTDNLQFSDYMRIVADPRGNSIVAYGTPSDLKYLQELVGKIDILLAQVRIEVVIAEVSLTKDQVRGIDSFSLDFDLDNLARFDFNAQGPGTSRVPQGYSVVGSIGNTTTTGTGDNQFSFGTSPISLVIDAARRESNVKVIQAPTIVTTHNQEATILVGESRPVITATQSDSTLGTSIRSNVQFRDIAIELKVKPLIGSNGIVQMEIDQKVESVVSSVEIDGNEQPIIGRRQATSFISVRDGELVVLGGLQQLDESVSKSRMAGLGSIPVIGRLFRSTAQEEIRRELLMFIQPTIVTTTDEAHLDARQQITESKNRGPIETFMKHGAFETEEDESKN